MNHLKSVKPAPKTKLPVYTVKGDYAPVPAGEYTAQIKSIESDRYKDKRDCIKFTFEVIQGPFVGRLLTGWVNAPVNGKSASTNTKVVRWYQIMIGYEMAEDDVLDFDELIGRIVVVRTKVNETRLVFPRKNGHGSYAAFASCSHCIGVM